MTTQPRPNLFADPPAQPPFLTLRDLLPPPVSEVCPHCKCEVVAHRFCCDGHPVRVTGKCPEHGEVTPIRSVVVNRL